MILRNTSGTLPAARPATGLGEKPALTFPRDLRLRLLGMVLPDPFFRQFAREQTHLEGQEDTLFSRHCALNLQLEGSSRRSRTASGHGQM
jgi:hypothetical protein